MTCNNNINKLKIVTFLMMMSIVLAPLRNYGLVVLGLNFSLFRIASILYFIAFFSYSLYYDIKYRNNEYIRITLLIFLFSVFAVIYSPNISGNVSNYFSMVFGFFWILITILTLGVCPEKIPDCFKIVVISALFPLLLGEYQSISFQLTGITPDLPFQFLVASEGDLGLMYNKYMRVTSCFGDPTYYATFMVISIGIVLCIFKNKECFGYGKIFNLICLLVFMLSVFQTFQAISFSGIIGIVVVIIFNIFSAKNKMKGFIFLTLTR